MTALVRERLTSDSGDQPRRGTIPVADAVRPFKGAMIALDVNGRAVPANTIANGALRAIGKASFTSPLSTSAGEYDVEVEYGVWGWENDGTNPVTIADRGKVCYMRDDQTVSNDSEGGTLGEAGFVSHISETTGKVHVEQGPSVVGSASAAAATARGETQIPMSAFTLAANGAPLIVFNDGVADGSDFDEGLSYRFNVASTTLIGTSVAMPQDLDAGSDVEVHMLASRVGAADPTAVVTVGAFFQTVGAAHDADVDAGGDTNALSAATTVVQELTLVIAAADVPAAPNALSLTLVPDAALDADDMRIHAVWLEYNRSL